MRGPRSELSRSTGRLEICLSFRCCHPGGVAGGHERFQVSAASLDQGLGPNMQEIVAHHLAQSASVSNQAGGHGAFDVEFCLPASCFSLCSSASLHWWARGWLAAHSAHRYPDLYCSLGFGCCFLYLRPAGVASADMDEGDSFSAVSACLGNWSLAE